jgi:hypothetical protein
MKGSTRILSALIASTLFFGALPPQSAQAGMIESPTALAWKNGSDVRQGVAQLLVRQDVRDALLARGVKPEAVADRVAALSDDEARDLSQRIDQLPAGGDGFLGVLFAVFIILLVTDILGLTKVFPFTRSINHR